MQHHLPNVASPEVRETLSFIEGLESPHLDNRLLASYIKEALNTVLTVRYVKDGLQTCDARPLLDTWTYIVEAIMSALSPLLLCRVRLQY